MRAIFQFAAIVVCFATSALNSAHGGTLTLYPLNNGFEVSNLGSGAGAYEYGSVPDWTIAGNPGIAANGSAFGVNGATNGNSDGTTSAVGQAALLQGGTGLLTGVSISQSISGFGPGTAEINFSAENRGCCSGGSATVNVYLNGALIDTVTPPVNSFMSYSTAFVPVSAGSNTISFAGLVASGDQTAFIDNVSVTEITTPEPSALAAICGLMAIGFVGYGIRRRSAR